MGLCCISLKLLAMHSFQYCFTSLSKGKERTFTRRHERKAAIGVTVENFCFESEERHLQSLKGEIRQLSKFRVERWMEAILTTCTVWAAQLISTCCEELMK